MLDLDYAEIAALQHIQVILIRLCPTVCVLSEGTTILADQRQRSGASSTCLGPCFGVRLGLITVGCI